MNGNPIDDVRARHASTVFTYRDEILERWLALVEFGDDEPAGEFVRAQLDASLLALGHWLLGDQQVEQSSMAMHWRGIAPNRELIAQAVVAMGLLPEAVQSTMTDNGLSSAEVQDILPSVAAFARLISTRVLTSANLGFNEEQWNAVALEVEERYAAQRAQRVKRLNVLTAISHAVSASRDTDSLLTHVLNAIHELIGNDYTEISLRDHFTDELRTQNVVVAGERRPDLEQRARERSLVNDVARHGRAIHVTDYLTACRERGIEPVDPLNDEQQRAWAGIPLIQGDEFVGVIAVSSPLTSFEPEDIELLSAVARQTAVALANHRLIAAREQHLRRLAAVNRLAREIAEIRDPDQLVATAAALIRELFGYGLVTIFDADERNGRLTMRSCAPLPLEHEHFTLALPIEESSVVGRVAVTRQPIRVEDVRTSDVYLATPETSSTRSEMAAPIIYAGQLLGVLDVQSSRTSAFDEGDLTTLNTIADQIAVGLENGRLFTDEAKRRRELEVMLSTTRAASSSLVLDQVLERLAEGIAEASGTSHCLVHIFDAEERLFRPAMIVGPESEEPPGPLVYWNQVIAVDDYPDIQHAIADTFPALVCCYDDLDGKAVDGSATLLVPLSTRKRTLGLAVVSPSNDLTTSYPESQIRLIQGVADSAALAVENAHLYARAHGLAIADERRRLAQQIHDTLAQGLTAISLQLDLADSYLPAKPEQAAKNVQRALELTRQNLDEARRSVLDLRAADVHEMSLPAAISQLVRRLGDTSKTRFELQNEGLTGRLSARIEVGLYRIVEEALENARKHSNATLVRVTIGAENGSVQVHVEDDGQGFDPAGLAKQAVGASGFGLVGIRERARMLGGSLTISSNPGFGTRLRVSIPYEGINQTCAPIGNDRGGLK